MRDLKPVAAADLNDRVAVIDIGSNSIRLVVYEGRDRATLPIYNEKVLCGLGRDLARTGTLHAEGVARALENLVRFRHVLQGMGVQYADALATAAVREASDGQAFAQAVAERCGLDLIVVSGAEEARLSALGVLAGTPDADGVMGDLGGGSLELVGLRDGRLEEHVTLPLGPFRLMAMKNSAPKAREIVRSTLEAESWLEGYRNRRFYAVGGAWRSIAKVDIAVRQHPIHVIHQYLVGGDDIGRVSGLLARQGKSSLQSMAEVSKRRVETLPWAAVVMEQIVDLLAPESVVFSAFGLREGHLYDLLPQERQQVDPLVAGATDFDRRHGRTGRMSALGKWIGSVFADETADHARLRYVAGLLSDGFWGEHPDHRAEHAFLGVLRMQLTGVTHPQRAFLAAATFARYGGHNTPDYPALALLDSDDLTRALRIGLALRLAHTLSGGVPELLDKAVLTRTEWEVRLALGREVAWLAGDAVQRRVEALARAFGLAGRIVVDESHREVAE